MPKTEWLIKLPPIEITVSAKNRKQAVKEALNAIKIMLEKFGVETSEGFSDEK